MTAPSSADYCRHFAFRNSYAVRGPTCAVGIDLAVPGAMKPCTATPEGTCPKREPYTGEEREEILAKEVRSINFRRALQAVSDAAGKADDRKTWGTGGEIQCPNCAGRISWSRSRLNGHVWAKCSTRGCFAVMQ